MSFDLLLRKGTVIDGTGGPRYHADVALSDGKIVAIGDLGGARSKRVIDASDLIVSPGFIDPHAHYDAQFCWDATLSPSSWHGVTSVVSGNCGVGIAPCRPGARAIATADLVGVEGLPLATLNEGISWNWETFPEYIDAINHRRPSINMVMLAPLTPLRQFVMGEAAIERSADDEETGQIAQLLEAAITAGAAGFSSSRFLNHIGYGGKPLAARQASDGEYLAYARALARLGQGTIQMALTQKTGVVSDEEVVLLDMLLRESGRPVTWSAVVYRGDLPEAHRQSLDKSAEVRSRGALPQVSALPITREITMRSPVCFASFPSFAALVGVPVEKLRKAFSDSGFRDAFKRDVENRQSTNGDWAAIRVTHIDSPALSRYFGWTIAEIAAERGIDGTEAILDISLEDNLATEFAQSLYNSDQNRVAEILSEPGTLLGLADGGAHVDSICDVRQTTYFLGKWIRERNLMTLEQGVKKITADPADMFGLRSRGRIQLGKAADITIFDAATIDCADQWEKRTDLPGGANRVVVGSKGVHYTIVNGEIAWENNSVTDARSGRVVNS